MAKKGVDLEKVVEIIERSLSPSAIVTQDEDLPVLTSATRTRQCDVVIRTGPPHRQTLSIAEVQDRNSAVTIGAFTNWLGKAEEVGAQHLICVSRKPFPESIRELATQRGGKVILINLKEIPKESPPPDFIDITLQYIHRKITIDSCKVEIPPGTLGGGMQLPTEMTQGERVWLHVKDGPMSILELCSSAIAREEIEAENHTSGNNVLHIPLSSRILKFITDEVELPVGITCEFSWKGEFANVPMTLLSYEQSNHGPLAWFFEAEYKSKTGNIRIKQPVVRLESGDFKLLDEVVSSPHEYTIDLKTKTPQ